MTQRALSASAKATPIAVDTSTTTLKTDPHELERLIQRSLQSHAGLKFSRLTVHQCPQGVCLEGLLESNENGLDLCELVEKFAGVKAINRVVLGQSVN